MLLPGQLDFIVPQLRFVAPKLFEILAFICKYVTTLDQFQLNLSITYYLNKFNPRW